MNPMNFRLLNPAFDGLKGILKIDIFKPPGSIILFCWLHPDAALFNNEG
jgi:hypothetical protein